VAYDDYLKYDYKCKRCKWNGKGAEAVNGDFETSYSFDITCPQCKNHLDFISTESHYYIAKTHDMLENDYELKLLWEQEYLGEKIRGEGGSHHDYLMEEDYYCGGCRWKGKGSTADHTNRGFYPYFIELRCPFCAKHLAFAPNAGFEDIMRTGTQEERDTAIKYYRAGRNSFLRDNEIRDNLPKYVIGDVVVVSLVEEIPEGQATVYQGGHIVLYLKGKEIWREKGSFEYYDRYLRLGEILKEKYGNQLVDFEVEYTADLGGDSGFSFNKVKQFRESLKQNRKRQGLMIWVTATQQLWDLPPLEYTLVKWETPGYELKWLDNLVAEGKATLVDGRKDEGKASYRIIAGDILPLVRDDESFKTHCGPISSGECKVLRDAKMIVERKPDEPLCIRLLNMRSLGE